ncbi:cytochrome P450 2C31-like [Acanthaster planci]|uniref:Cytochrome P450 2C31-like n=1 Tax=Acanthaster planci TaxID=133434 RepID=A0A8B7ZSH6_ACAPL|nr:cytochrome P450 2C31-like [Acanthaster planci]XP_022108365.1 cytochrome P450 2C31-like [Acanthaster planci]
MVVSAAVGGGAVTGVFTVTGTTIALGATALVLVVLLLLCLGGSSGGLGAESPPVAPGERCVSGHLGIMTGAQPSWITLNRIGKEKGDVMSLKVGHWVIMLNTFAAIKDAAINFVKEMGSRPTNYTTNLLSENGKDISLGEYSHDWLLLREMGIKNLREFTTNKRLEEVVHIILNKLEEDLDKKENQPVNVKDITIPATAGVLSHLCFGFDADASVHDRVAKLLSDGLFKYIVGPRLLANFIPILRFFPSNALREAQATVNELNGLLRSEMKRHQESLDPDITRDLMDGIIKCRNHARETEPDKYEFLTETHAYQVISNYLGGAAGALVVALQTGVALFVSNPEQQEKFSAAVTSVVGEDRMPGLDDQEKSVYVRATIEEILRYACIAPISVPHKTSEDITFRGFKIPANTGILVNFYGLHFNEEYWPEPFNFKPERFIDERGNFRSDEHMYPFGYGARSCVGQPVARQLMYLILSWLTHRYALCRVPGEEDRDLLQQDPDVQVVKAVPPFDLILKRRF